MDLFIVEGVQLYLRSDDEMRGPDVVLERVRYLVPVLPHVRTDGRPADHRRLHWCVFVCDDVVEQEPWALVGHPDREIRSLQLEMSQSNQ